MSFELTNEMKSSLITKVDEMKNSGNKAEIDLIEQKIAYIKSKIGDHTRYICTATKNEKEEMLKLEILRNKNNSSLPSIGKEVTALANHQYVVNLDIEEKRKLVVYTDYIDIYDENSNRFKGNKYRIVIDFRYGDVRIHGLDDNYSRNGYWTNTSGVKDPHPHVDGRTGSPCLGDAGSMIAQTMADGELFASFIVILGFLQQVNTHDVAGKFVRNWDCINENGELIDNPHVPEYTCNKCGCGIDDEEQRYYCEDCDESYCEDCTTWLESRQTYICYRCLERNYRYCDKCEEYSHRDNVTHVADEYICDGCLDEYYEQCDECNDYYNKEDVFHCDSCDHYYCYDCKQKYDVGEEYICEDCYEGEPGCDED